MVKATQSRRAPGAEPNSVVPVTVPHVVIVGGGFGGLTATKKLADQPVHVTLIDRTNYHLFQPMLYQVATSALAAHDIASPLRDILQDQQNATVIMAEVVGVDTRQQLVQTAVGESVHYDYLILATGAQNNYFGHPEWEERAAGMKSLEDAIVIRNSVMATLEAADREPDEEKRKAMLTVVLVGGGPTGCELAAMVAEHKRGLKRRKFQRVKESDVRILLVEGEPRLMASFHPALSAKVQRRLTKDGVEIRTGVHVKEITDRGVVVGDEFVNAHHVLWTAGVKASPVGQWLHVDTDHSGRVKVQRDFSVPGHPNIFVLGDAALAIQHGKPLPGLAQPALQEGSYVAAVIADQIAGKEHTEPFKYRDKGSLAVVGRTYAVFESGPVHMAGPVAWLIWVFVHIYFLVGFRNRLAVLWTYAWAYLYPFQHSPGSRLIIASDRSVHAMD
jgi:NADH dehydrogenase